MRNPRLPKLVRLPFGYVARVVLLEHDDFIADFGRAKASWVGEEMTIYLDRSRSIRKLRADLAHEVGHVCLDWSNDVLQSKYTDGKG